MSGPYSFRPKGKLADRFEEAIDDLSENQTKSELICDVVDEGLRVKEKPLYTRLGFSNPLGAQLEDEREIGQDRAEFLEEVAEDGLKARNEDALDAIEASDQLRERVEATQRDDEDLESALRRLVREGVEASTETAQKREAAHKWAERFVIAFFSFAMVFAVGESVLQLPLPIPIVTVTIEDLLTAALMVTLAVYLFQRLSATASAYFGDKSTA